MLSELNFYQKSLFLIFLTVAGNFIAETLSCGSQKILENNMLVKSSILFFLIYFTMDLGDSEAIHPFSRFKRAFGVFVILLMFTKMNNLFTGLTLLLLIASYLTNNFIQYYNAEHSDDKEKNSHKELLSKLHKLQTAINYSIFVVLVIGFILYFIKQKRDHKNFSYSKFLFGVQKCGSKR